MQSRAPALSAAGLKKGLDAMNNRRPAQAGELPRHAKAQSGVVGELDAGVMSAPEISLTLADGTVIKARLQRVASDAKHGSQSWVGTFDDAPGSVLVLTKARGVVTGFANYQDQILEIQPAAGGKHGLFLVDESRLPKGEVLRAPKLQGDAAGSTVSDFGLGSTTAVTNVVQDVLVLYTAASAAAMARRLSKARSSRRSSLRTRLTRTAWSGLP